VRRDGRKEDIVGDYKGPGNHSIAILLGVAERGESSKTGLRQGVRPDRPMIASMWNKYREEAGAGELVFTIRPEKLREHWDDAATSTGVPAGPLHTIRHIGPSHDLAGSTDDPTQPGESGPYRTMNQVRVRGSWRAKTSMLRYGKTHALLAAAAREPAATKVLGMVRLQQLGRRPLKALE
jgi:hypothetical protein